MNVYKQLTTRLRLDDIVLLSSNDDDTVKALRFNFTFCDSECFIDVTKDGIRKDYPSFAFGECDTDLSESFFEQVEGEHWDTVREYWAKYEAEHNIEYGLTT